MITAYNPWPGLTRKTDRRPTRKSAFLEVGHKGPDEFRCLPEACPGHFHQGRATNKDAKDLLTKLVAKSPKGRGGEEEAQKLLDQLK